MVDFDKMFSVGVEKNVLSDDFDGEPVENGGFSFGNFELVGHGEVTNENCGRFSGYHYGCLRVDLHNKVIFDKDGKRINCANKVYAKPFFHSCDKPSCPICYKYGWAVREARRIEARLAEASKRFGLVEHIIATFPPKYYHLTYEQLRLKAVEILKSRGVVGGVLIFHGFRYNKREYWYWSPHFHVLGFVLGGYRCRSCKIVRKTGKCGIENVNCSGFVNRNYRCYEKDGCIVKVKGKRKTVMGTAWYQLNHASVKKGVKRFHVATWFGNCSYRKLKVTAEMRKSVCPICKHDLEKLRYNGAKLDVWILSYGGAFFADFEEEGFLEGSKEVVWQVVVNNYGSGSYEA